MEVIQQIEVPEVLLLGRRQTQLHGVDISSSSSSSNSSSSDGVDLESSEMIDNKTDEKEDEKKDLSQESVYLDMNAGDVLFTDIVPILSVLDKTLILEDSNVQKLLNSVINDQDGEILNYKTTSSLEAPLLGSSQEQGITNSKDSSKRVTEHVKIDIIDESDEEVVELEFERAVGKMHTHNMYCPNCSAPVTKVILRRRKSKPKTPPPSPEREKQDKPMDLLGCLSCFRIFIPSGNRLNPFRCFGTREEHESIQQNALAATLSSVAPSASHQKGETIIKKGSVLDWFWIFGKGKENNALNSQQLPRRNINNSQQLPRGNINIPSYQQDIEDADKHVEEGNSNGATSSEYDSNQALLLGSKSPQYETSSTLSQAKINGVATDASTNGSWKHYGLVGADTQPLIDGERGTASDSKSLEILKSIVYGGLVESIASLSIVSSAAASDATTMNIVALGLASVVSGIFIIVHNLRDLKNECRVEEETDEQTDRYRELIGRRENFLLHFTIAILSFIVFGLIPPVVYGFSFQKSDNEDFKILAVAAASLTIIVILAIGKAYVKGACRFSEYLKSVLYYVSNAVAVSGVAYAVGDLIKILMEKVGWFEPSAPANLFISGPFQASY